MSLERGLGLGLHGTHDGTAHYEGARAVDSEHGSESRSRAFAQHLGFIIRYKNKNAQKLLMTVTRLSATWQNLMAPLIIFLIHSVHAMKMEMET